MYRITNIAASREEGCWHHNPNGFSPDSHTLQFEPWIAGMQLKLYESRVITDRDYLVCKEFIDDLYSHRIVKAESLEPDISPIKIQPKIEVETTKTFDLSVPDTVLTKDEVLSQEDLPRTKKRYK